MLYSEVEDSLSHIGVKGMRWGHRKAEGVNSASTSSKRGRLAARDNEIQAARDRYKANARNDYLKAKTQYNIDKKIIGKDEAKVAFDSVKRKNLNDAYVAQQVKSGREKAAYIAVVSAGLLISSLSVIDGIRHPY